MKFKSSQIKGKGRGKLLGFPTINLQIPADFSLEDGIYAVKVFANNKNFLGAMHYGPIPVFKEDEKTLEVFLIDTEEKDIPRTPNFEIETIKFLREIRNFNNQEELAQQIGKDVEDVLQLS